MTKPNDHAFPTDLGAHTASGMTKREYFAALAMHGLLANASYNLEYAASDAVAIADELIAALNAKQEERG